MNNDERLRLAMVAPEVKRSFPEKLCYTASQKSAIQLFLKSLVLPGAGDQLPVVSVFPFGFVLADQRWLINALNLPSPGFDFTLIAHCQIVDSIFDLCCNSVVEPLIRESDSWAFYPPAPCKFFTMCYMPPLKSLYASVRFGLRSKYTKEVSQLGELVLFQYSFGTKGQEQTRGRC